MQVRYADKTGTYGEARGLKQARVVEAKLLLLVQ